MGWCQLCNACVKPADTEHLLFIDTLFLNDGQTHREREREMREVSGGDIQYAVSYSILLCRLVSAQNRTS